MRFAGRVTALVALWLLAWGEISIASLGSGVAVASLLLVVFPPGPPAAIGFHPVAVGRLLVYVSAQLVASNLVMAWQILRRRPDAEPGVLAHRLERPSEEVVTAMTSVIALSPGTMTVDTASDSSVIFVHFLFLDDVQAARESLTHLERLVVDAIVPEKHAPRRSMNRKESS